MGWRGRLYIENGMPPPPTPHHTTHRPPARRPPFLILQRPKSAACFSERLFSGYVPRRPTPRGLNAPWDVDTQRRALQDTFRELVYKQGGWKQLVIHGLSPLLPGRPVLKLNTVILTRRHSPWKLLLGDKPWGRRPRTPSVPSAVRGN